MEKATEKQLWRIKKDRPDLYRKDLTKQEAYKIIDEITSSVDSIQVKQPINEAVLGMCFKLGKKYSQDPIGLYDEFLAVKAKLESR